MRAQTWYFTGLTILLLFAGWFSFWTLMIALTALGLFDGRIGLVDLREFISIMPAAYVLSFYALNALILAAVATALMRRRIAAWLFPAALVWDALNWVVFTLSSRYDNTWEMVMIGLGSIGAWCLYQWSLSAFPGRPA